MVADVIECRKGVRKFLHWAGCVGGAMGQNTLTGKVAIVTGAGSGIGRAICFELAAAGAHLCLAARRKEPLEKLADELVPAKSLICPTDVSNKRMAEELAQKTFEEFGRIDYIFNCAGVFRAGGFGGLDNEAISEMVDINLLGTVYCMRAVIPQMRKQGSGHIVNIASLGGKYPFPGSTGYSASKFAVVGFSNALRHELKPEGIHLTVVYPSFVRSPLLDAHLPAVQNSLFFRLTGNYKPQQVAAAIIKAVVKKKRELVAPPFTRLTVPLYGLFPGLMEALIGKMMGGWPPYEQEEAPSSSAPFKTNNLKESE